METGTIAKLQCNKNFNINPLKARQIIITAAESTTT
jgi:hypothetical protein